MQHHLEGGCVSNSIEKASTSYLHSAADSDWGHMGAGTGAPRTLCVSSSQV